MHSERMRASRDDIHQLRKTRPTPTILVSCWFCGEDLEHHWSLYDADPDVAHLIVKPHLCQPVEQKRRGV